MKLKRVKIFGFKTFADRTDVELDGNIISIIGPNGCGKSNIVDAILWGLGESNARNLRAQTAKEVIFAGSGGRKPLGFAEVSLHFDNEDGALPIDAAEVVVTRRLNRAGDSDYAINRRACRLRDVNDLLADSGLGRAGYAIVTQSDIDQALSASAAQRRAWIDEAAGVQRYRARRVESMRSLDSADAALARVYDIIGEIELQRGPLAAEAEAAKEYKIALNSLRQIESDLLCHELASSQAEVTALDERIGAAAAESDRETKRLENLTKARGELDLRLAQLREKSEELRESLHATQSRLDQAEGQIQLNIHKLENFDELERSLSEESDASANHLAEVEAELDRARQEAELEQNALAELERSLAGADTEAKQLARELRRVDEELGAARKIQAEHEQWKAERAHAQQRLKAIRQELAGIEADLPRLEEAVAEAERSTEAADSELKSLASEVENANQALAELLSAEEQAAAQSRQLLGQIAALEGRCRGIEASIQANEGVAQGAKFVLDAAQSGRLRGSYIPLGRAIHADEEFAVAIETALGAAGSDLIVEHESDARAAIELLKSERAGRATFQPVTLMRPLSRHPQAESVAREAGVLGWASDLVECEPIHRPVVESLLGRTLILRDLDSALRLARKPGWSKIVTLDGELIHGTGAVTGGAFRSRGGGMVQRQAELDSLLVQVEELRRELSTLSHHDRETQRVEIEEARNVALTRKSEYEKQLSEARAWLQSLRHERQAAIAQQSRLIAESDQLLAVDQARKPSAEVGTIEARRDDLTRQLAAKSSDAESAQTRLTEARRRAAESKERASSAQRRLAHLRESRESRQRRLAGIDPERIRIQESIAVVRAQVATLQTEIADRRAELDRISNERTEAADESSRLRDEITRVEQGIRAGADVLHNCELKRARADSRRSAATERLLEEYGIDPEVAIEKSAGIMLAPDAAEIAGRLRKEIKQMGEVNLGAIEAYERLTERHDELSGQVEDIEQGIAEIKSSIRELDALTREKFERTFAELQTAFSEVFVRLLGGGEASLELSQPENVLDSGVEISVTIPGKKRQRLELLSGGERAMSALAFLFSLLKVRPCPLVVLDEVDAPLDGGNVERFIRLMREFNQETQFILITHNNVTISSADVWLGVTMQEPGVSTLVPFRVPEPANAASLA